MREAAAAALYLAACGFGLLRVATVRPLWYDELYTLYLARVGCPLDLWGHLAAGVDLNPPLGYLLARLSVLAFGEAEWSLRLPSVLGGLAAAGSAYAFVRRRSGPPAAWAAMTAVTLSGVVWLFFQEARPYALMCGFAGLLLVCWQRATDAARRRWWLLGMAVAGGLGALSHYYFVLPAAAVGVGELVRANRAKRLDWPVLVSLAAAGLAVAACYPAWSAAQKAYAPGFWSKTAFTPAAVLGAYVELFDPPAVVAAGVALLLAFVARLVRPPVVGRPSPPASESAAVVALALLPVAGVFLGATVTGGFYFRYVLPAALGFAVLVAWLIDRVGGPSACGLAAVAFAAVGPALAWPWAVEHERAKATDLPALTALLNEKAAGGTVVMASSLQFVQQSHYATDRTFAAVFVADPALATHHRYADTADRGLLALSRVAPVTVTGPDAIVEAVKRGEPVFYLYPPDGDPGWPWKEFEARGLKFTPAGEVKDVGLLFRVTGG